MRIARPNVWSFVAVLACFGSAACEPSATGQLAAGTFTYDCIERSDYGCITLGALGDESIAVGAPFRLDYEPDGDTTNPDGTERALTIVPESGELVDATSERFVFRDAGTAAFVARLDDEVIDRIELTAERIAGLELTVVNASGDNELVPPDVTFLLATGAKVTVGGAPLSASGGRLYGTVEYAVASSDSAVVSATLGTGLSEFELVGEAEGDATLSFSVSPLDGDGPTTVEVPVAVGAP